MKRWTFLLPLLLAAVAISGALYSVDENEAVITTQFGRVVGHPVAQPGLHLKVPLVHRLSRLSLAPYEWSWHGQLLSADKQALAVDCTARWKVVEPMLFYERARSLAGAAPRIEDLILGELRNRASGSSRAELEEAPGRVIQRVFDQIADRTADLGIELLGGELSMQY